MNDKAPQTPDVSDSILGRTVQRLDPPHGPRPHHRSPIVGVPERAGQRAAERAAGRSHADKAGAAAGAGALPKTPAEPAPAASQANTRHLDGLERRLRQAAELADFLKQRMADLDRREAQLNAREAAVEQQERMTQLWIEEKTREINETRAELHGEIQEFAAERQRFQDAQLAWRRRHQEAESELLSSSQRLGRDRAAFEAMCRQVQREQDAARLRIQSAERRAIAREQENRDEQEKLRRACTTLLAHSRQFRLEATEVIELRQQLAARMAKLQDFLDYRLEQLHRQRQAEEKQSRQRKIELDGRERDIAGQLQRMIHERTELITEKLAVQQLWNRICAQTERPRAEQQLTFLRMQVHDQFQRQYRELRTLQGTVERQIQQLRWERDRWAAQTRGERAA